jgi:hypothetical protein
MRGLVVNWGSELVINYYREMIGGHVVVDSPLTVESEIRRAE